MSSKRVAWIGLGLIGLPMAARLAAAGWDVRGFDVSGERLRLAGERGIKPAASLEDAVAGARFVFTSLPNEQVLVELAPRLVGDAIWIETSTVGPVASAKAGQGRMAYLRAPVSGSTALAEAGTLTTFVSGPRDAFEAARPALAAYSRAQIWVGEGDEARYAKLAVNLMVAVTAGMMGEALALAKSGGIDWSTMLDVIGDSVVASPLVKYKLEPLRRRDFTPAATGALVLKDLDLMIEAARQAGLDLPLAAHMQSLYRGLEESRLLGQDFFSISAPNSVPGT
ncbi:MAG TPA: NAD(P)-dependent oxidoreductase [Burkholderiales bacterium]|nr:NAD(P)-dependent oxidoreductase [Burkholderiales bacterium]